MPPSPSEFEDEVRRVARALWPSAATDGADMVNGREVDGLFYTEEVVHHVEATMLRTVEKAHHDGPKLRDHLKRHRSGRGKFAKAWFVTFYDPTGDQRKAIRSYDANIEVISLDQFRSRLVNGREYLRLRDSSIWGSAVSPLGRGHALPEYVPLTLSILGETAPPKLRSAAVRAGSSTSSVDLNALLVRLAAGQRIALLGDYGAGKSMTVREAHRRLAEKYLKFEAPAFPITLNLREHYGQTSPEEALERHAGCVGFTERAQLVRAWKAGYVHVLLDGFDELAAPGWSGELTLLRENRRAATALIRQFSTTSRPDVGVLVSGRRYYFDTLTELGVALFEQESHTVVSLSDFSDEQSRCFISALGGGSHAVPAWLPARPLLLGHLAAEGLLEDLGTPQVTSMAPAAGWNWLLTRVCERESFIKLGMDGDAVRSVLERLASAARSTSQGVGPLSPYDLSDAFASVRRQRPSDEDLTLLQRLPGLGGEEESREEGTRSFIDVDFASACQAGDVADFVLHPFARDGKSSDSRERSLRFQPGTWSASMEPLGVEVAAERLPEAVDIGVLRAAFLRAVDSGWDVLATDVLRVAVLRGSSGIVGEGKPLILSEVVIPTLDLDETDHQFNWSGVTFSQCLISELSISGDPNTTLLPRFSECTFDTVLGRLGPKDLPTGIFDACSFDNFPEGVDRNSSILDASSLPVGTRVVMTLLRKLYLQRGRGRKDSALSRGMSTKEQALVRPAIKLLEREKLAVATRLGTSLVWLPDRSAGPRVRAFLEAPRVGHEPLVAGAQALG